MWYSHTTVQYVVVKTNGSKLIIMNDLYKPHKRKQIAYKYLQQDNNYKVKENKQEI